MDDMARMERMGMNGAWLWCWVGGGMRKEVDNLICEECGRKVWRVRKGLIT
jgi:hypothetical protein